MSTGLSRCDLMPKSENLFLLLNLNFSPQVNTVPAGKLYLNTDLFPLSALNCRLPMIDGDSLRLAVRIFVVLSLSKSCAFSVVALVISNDSFDVIPECATGLFLLTSLLVSKK